MSELAVESLATDLSYADLTSENEEFCIFTLPFVNDNVDGWGPNNQPEKYKDLPYQKFSKSDRIGKVEIEFSSLDYAKCNLIFCLRSPIGPA